MKKILALTAAIVALGFSPTHAHASDAQVLECRATQDAKISAGMCGAHGCDCGILSSECSAAKKYLNSFDAEGRQGMNYVREAYAYAHDCRK
jgi:hypothetical protein